MRHCTDTPPRELFLAVNQFNGGRWFECHETLEDLWAGETGEGRNLYQGVLQVAVALHHWRNGNFGGAISLLKGGTGYLRRTGAVCQQLDVTGLIIDADSMREALEALGPEQMKELAPEFIPKLRFAESPADAGEAGQP